VSYSLRLIGGVSDVSVESPILRVVSVLSLVLVLFTDAVSLNLREVRQHRTLRVHPDRSVPEARRLHLRRDAVLAVFCA